MHPCVRQDQNRTHKIPFVYGWLFSLYGISVQKYIDETLWLCYRVFIAAALELAENMWGAIESQPIHKHIKEDIMSTEQSLAQYSKVNPMYWIRRLYLWVLSLADTSFASPALFGLASVEAIIFPIPPDVLLLAMGLSKPKRVFLFAGICLLGSVLGGLIGYYVGQNVWMSTQEFFYTYIPGFTEEKFIKVQGLYQDNAFWALFVAGFTPIPFKIFTVTAGVAQIPIATFLSSATIGRGMRFFFGCNLCTFLW